MASELLVNKITPESGTTLTLGDSGDTISLPSGVSLDTLTITGDLTVDTDTLFVDASENKIAIGTTNVGTDADTKLNIFHTDSPTLLFERSSGNSNGAIRVSSGGLISFLNGADTRSVDALSERMRIDGSGDVGIGTSSLAGYRVSVKQSGNTSLASIGIASINSADDTYIGMGYDSASDTCRILATYSTNGAFKPITFLTSDAERMRIDVSGNVGIGTTSPSQALDVVGNVEVSGGIYLGGTTSANALDDYEEGTWTPVIQFGGNSVAVSYSTQVGKYTKIGRLVTYYLEVSLSSKGTSTGNLSFVGFPFVPVNTANPPSILTGTLSSTNDVQGYLSTSSSLLLENRNTGTQSNLTDTNVNSNSTFFLCGVYETS